MHMVLSSSPRLLFPSCPIPLRRQLAQHMIMQHPPAMMLRSPSPNAAANGKTTAPALPIGYPWRLETSQRSSPLPKWEAGGLGLRPSVNLSQLPNPASALEKTVVWVVFNTLSVSCTPPVIHRRFARLLIRPIISIAYILARAPVHVFDFLVTPHPLCQQAIILSPRLPASVSINPVQHTTQHTCTIIISITHRLSLSRSFYLGRFRLLLRS